MSVPVQRILTRADFDGLVCSVLLRAIWGRDLPVLWIEPIMLGRGQVVPGPSDCLANLPCDARAGWWFDHHVTNRPQDGQAVPQGAFSLELSAARVIWQAFEETLSPRFDELVDQADRIDGARFGLEEILHPEGDFWGSLSMSLSGGLCEDDSGEDAYRERVVQELLRDPHGHGLRENPLVRKRRLRALNREDVWRDQLMKTTRDMGAVTLTDHRNGQQRSGGSRFLVFALFPQSHFNIRVRPEDGVAERLVVSVGHSILQEKSSVSIGPLLTAWGGGGHHGAGSCSIAEGQWDAFMEEVLPVLQKGSR